MCPNNLTNGKLFEGNMPTLRPVEYFFFPIICILYTVHVSKNIIYQKSNLKKIWDIRLKGEASLDQKVNNLNRKHIFVSTYIAYFKHLLKVNKARTWLSKSLKCFHTLTVRTRNFKFSELNSNVSQF